MHRYDLAIGGKWVKAKEEKTFDVINPATMEKVGEVADGSADDAIKAVDAAYEAFPHWSSATARERSRYLRRLYELMMENQEELARIMTVEQGKPIREARGEIAYAADFLLWYSEEAPRVYGETIPSSHPDKRLFVIRQPVGVVAAITPWNFPAAMITRKLGPALAAGCTMVIKPAEQTPLTAYRLMELIEQAGIPAGVVNMVTTSVPQAVGAQWIQDPRVRKVTFTGSTEVGKEIMRQAAGTVKKVSLELGGHAPFLIFEDADLERAAEQAILSKFRNAGQTCICANRFYVQESVMADFAQVFADKVKKLKVGNGLAEETDIGPLIDGQAMAKVESHVKDAVQKGAASLAGGVPLSDLGPHFYAPTVLLGVDRGMRVTEEETFGPVAPILGFKDEQQALYRANDTRYGLAAYIHTRDLARAIRVAEGLEYGIVGVNDGVPSAAQAPFGGYKESGLGREGGHHGLEEYLETKYISIGGISV